ncbi:MAG: hypothetical protein ACR2GL_01215 [Thermoleophilaceae bacterium]
MKRFRYEYGASPLHLLVALLSLALAAWALSHALDATSRPGNVLVWLAGAVLLHDLLLIPLYSLLGLLAGGALRVGREGPSRRLRVAALNHLRVPALLSGLALLLWFPLILGIKEEGFMRTTALSTDVYLERWLLLSVVLFGGSAILFALRARRLRAQE